MAITLGQLRTFCREIFSADNPDATAAREFMLWINGALDKLYKESAWDRTITEQKLTIFPREAKTDISVTQGSLSVGSASLFLAKYVTEKWELILDNYRGTFELGSINTPASTALFRTGDEWIGSTATNLSGYFLNTRFYLPKVKEIRRVQVVDSGIPIRVCQPAEFDYMKSLEPGAMGSDPRFCTWRRGFLEIWPHPGDAYRKLSLTYQREFTQLADSALDAVEIDWDEEERDVLLKGIALQASFTQGENAVIPYQMALMEYREALNKSKGYSFRNCNTGPMSSVHPTPKPMKPGPWFWGTVSDA